MTDGQTDTARRQRPRYAERRAGKNRRQIHGTGAVKNRYRCNYGSSNVVPSNAASNTRLQTSLSASNGPTYIHQAAYSTVKLGCTHTYTHTVVKVVKVRGARGLSPPAPIWAHPANEPPGWIYKVLIYAQITPHYLGVEWVWGLFQPGFVRWAPLLHKTTLTTAHTHALSQAKLGRWLQTLSGRGSDGWFEVRLIRFTYCKNFNKRQVSVKRRRRINTGVLLPVA